MLRRSSALFVSLVMLLGCGDTQVQRAEPCMDDSECDAYELCLEGVCQLQEFPEGEEDADFDGLFDVWERGPEPEEGEERVDPDTDGDGIPDYLDSDSDGDGFGDAVEGAGSTASVPPRDSDGDGTPDFRDTDSDGNGILDADEGSEDTDGNGVLDAFDADDDGDLATDINEIGGDSAAPADFDEDGVPDFRDSDSDGDTITDVFEGVVSDTDGDETLDRYDDDSDGDGIADAVEAGDDDLMTPPVDTDGDGRADFQDIDSDGDGLLDSREVELGTSPTSTDSDMDGVPDLIEVTTCFDATCENDATDPESSVRTRGDFVFIEPYMEPQEPERDTLGFTTDIQSADIYFLMDTTGSMGTSITSLRASIASFIPQVRAMIPDVQVGLGDYKDYAQSPYGGTSDFAYRHIHDISDDVASLQAATNQYNNSGGSDLPESLVPAIRSMFYGLPLDGPSNMEARAEPCPPLHDGYPCFRRGALPIIIAITDIGTHNGPDGENAYDPAVLGVEAPTYDEILLLFRRFRARFIGIGQGSGGATFLRRLATDTGSVDATGAPYYSQWSGSIGDTVLTQIGELAGSTRLDISVRIRDDADDGVNAPAAFVSHLEANIMGAPELGCMARGALDDDGDGILDTYPNVPTMTQVCFDVVTKQNDMIEATEEPQLFRATVEVLGEGRTVLDTREIIFLVPPVFEDDIG